MRDFFYKPREGWAADFIPFYQDGAFRLFYLRDWRDKQNHGEGTPWYRIDTTDFVHFTEHGEMLPRGTVEEQDLYVFTGGVLAAGGKYHIFYTGHNPHLRAQGKPEQAVMHAVSDDLTTWRKIPEDTFFAPTDDGYEPHDWRDPFVFWNEEAGEYWMLLAARRTTGPSRRRGCTALCASHDLTTWEVRAPFWDPGLYFTHECPDLFRMDEWWYLVFSEFSERVVTRYRMSRTLAGPWLAPPDDTFDGRAFYAAKTAADDAGRRFLFGWNPTREQEKDYQPYQWGGNLVVHELAQEPNGTLSVRVPEGVKAAFLPGAPVRFQPGVGPCEVEGDATVRLSAPQTFACATAGPMPERCRIETTITFSKGTRGCGLVLRASDDFEAGYYVRLEPDHNRLVLDAWPRAGDVPFLLELERPLDLTPEQPVHLQVFVDRTVCEVYANGKVALSARLYNLSGGNWGVFATEGTARFTDATLAAAPR